MDHSLYDRDHGHAQSAYWNSGLTSRPPSGYFLRYCRLPSDGTADLSYLVAVQSRKTKLASFKVPMQPYFEPSTRDFWATGKREGRKMAGVQEIMFKCLYLL